MSVHNDEVQRAKIVAEAKQLVGEVTATNGDGKLSMKEKNERLSGIYDRLSKLATRIQSDNLHEDPQLKELYITIRGNTLVESVVLEDKRYDESKIPFFPRSPELWQVLQKISSPHNPFEGIDPQKAMIKSIMFRETRGKDLDKMTEYLCAPCRKQVVPRLMQLIHEVVVDELSEMQRNIQDRWKKGVLDEVSSYQMLVQINSILDSVEKWKSRGSDSDKLDCVQHIKALLDQNVQLKNDLQMHSFRHHPFIRGVVE